MTEISWTEQVKNEELLHRLKETSIMYAGKKGRLIGLVTSCTGTVF
jgi:hypothetical protein